jgi:hypothetical protein
MAQAEPPAPEAKVFCFFLKEDALFSYFNAVPRRKRHRTHQAVGSHRRHRRHVNR